MKYPYPVIPYGLCCVASSLEEAGREVKVLDLCFSKNPGEDIQEAVQTFRPGVMGLSIRNIDNGAGHNPDFLLVQTRDEVVRPCLEHFKGPIVIGGPAVGINGPEMLEYLDLEYAIRGDGERALPDLVNRLESGQNPNETGGLVRRRNGRITTSNEPWPVKNLDSLPPVRLHRYVDLARYRPFDSPLQIQTKRGCPLGCVYCTYNGIEGYQYRLRSPERVADEIDTLVSETGINHIEITDSTFNLPLSHCKDVLRAIIRRSRPLRLRTMGLNPSAVDEELVDLLIESGFTDVDLGAESASDPVLKAMGKNYTKADVIRAGRLLRDKKLPTSWMLLVGGPGETPRTMAETFETVRETAGKWDIAIVAVGIRIYKGSPMAVKMQAENPGCTRDNFLTPLAFQPEGLSMGLIRDLTKRAWYRYGNFLMYSEDMTFPEQWLKSANAVLKAISPRMPVWRIFLISRFFEKYLGLDLLGRIRLYRKNRDLFTALDRGLSQPWPHVSGEIK